MRPKMELSWSVLVPYAITHAMCLGVFFTGACMRDLVLWVGSFFIRMLGLSIGYHRYFAHRSFKTGRGMQFALALLAVLAMQRGPLWWAQTHRAHHRHTDTPKDLHSPKHQGFAYAHWGWFMNRRHFETRLEDVPDLACYPELVWLNDWRGYILPMGLYIGAILLVGGVSGLIWGYAISTVMLFHLTHWIQSMSHCFGGYRRFPTRDSSRNHLFIGFLSLGEWHNNHHFYPSSARQGYTWWELDVGYWVLRALQAVRLVWDVRVIPDHVARSRKTLREIDSPVHGS